MAVVVDKPSSIVDWAFVIDWVVFLLTKAMSVELVLESINVVHAILIVI